MNAQTLKKLMEDFDKWREQLPDQKIGIENIIKNIRELCADIYVLENFEVQKIYDPKENISLQKEEAIKKLKKEFDTLNNFLKNHPDFIAKKIQPLVISDIFPSEPSKIDISHHTPHN